MNWLKQIGLDLVKAFKIAATYLPVIGPIIAAANPVVGVAVSDFTKILNVVTTIEGSYAAVNDPSAKTGSMKLESASPFVAQLFMEWLQSGVLGSKSVKDQAKFQQGVKDVTSGFVEILNSVGT